MVCPSCNREIADYSNFCYFCGTRQELVMAPQMHPAGRKLLMRSATNSRLGGVCGGIADYLDVDPTIVRLVWALVTFFSGIVLGTVFYFIAWIVMPLAPVPASRPEASPVVAAEPGPSPAS
jgi:phage shock protein C